MIKSINQLVTERCNSKCQMCSIWKIKDKSLEMSPDEFDKLYSMPEFRDLEDLCISGGEATMRSDLFEVIDSMIKHLPKLNMLFLSTNGSNPEVAQEFMKRYSPAVKDIYICPSIDGDRKTHRIIRGVDTYSKVLKTTELVNQLNLNNSHTVFSTTIVPENCNTKSLDHVRDLAKKYDCSFSFRPASKNESFYHNKKSEGFMIGSKGFDFMKNYMQERNISDPFLDILFDYIQGKDTLMGSPKKGIECLAGDISIFIKPDGEIYPCINSTRLIGNKKLGLFKEKYSLGDKELCPCCTECQVYPMLNFSQYAG